VTRVAKRHQRVASVAVTLTAIALLAVLAWLAWDAWRYPSRPTDPAGGQASVTIKRGMRFPEILAELTAKRAVTRPFHFRLYANVTGRAHKIRAGSYTIERAWTPRQVLQRLVEGVKEEEVQVTIPEGKNMLEVVDLLAEAGVAPADELLAHVRDQGFVASLGLRGTTLEGYLFPDTYKFRPKTPAPKALGVLVKRHRQVFEDVRGRHPEGAEALKRKYKLSDRDAVTLASIVERETARADERPRVASVYLNRIAAIPGAPRKLQADPTIIYGCVVPVQKSKACQKFDGRIRRIQLNDAENPYNTYQREGLPPGPIGNPGRAALEAVFAPETSTYLYFVSRNDGSHAFARTEAEHNANVRRYQLGQRTVPATPP